MRGRGPGPVRVLLVERERDGTDTLRTHLEGDFQVHTVAELSQGLARLSRSDVDLVLLELNLADSDGMSTFERIYAFRPDLPVVVVTDEYDEALGMSAVQAGAQDYVARGDAETSVLPRVIRYAVERHALHTALRALSLVDDLTGLYNTRGFMHLAEHHIALQRRLSRGVILARVDVDHLQTINEALGHHVGDRALRRVADILRENVRRSDLAARLGEDDFVVLGLEASDDGTVPIVRRIRDGFADFNEKGRESFLLSISIGIARCDDTDRASLDELMQRADAALKAEKQAKLSQILR